MERIRLITADDRLVGYATILPFQKLAEGVVFGTRTFFLAADVCQQALLSAQPSGGDPKRMLVYREGLMVPVTEFSATP